MYVGASSPPLSLAMLRSSQPPRQDPVHESCPPRGRLERGDSSAVVESMTSPISVAMSLMQVSSGIGDCAAIIVFANKSSG